MLAPLVVSLFVAHAEVGTPPAQISPAALLPEAPTAVARVTVASVPVESYCEGSGACGPQRDRAGVGSLGADVPVGERMAVRAQVFGVAEDSTPLGGLWVSVRGPVVEERRRVVSPWVAAGMVIFDREMSFAGDREMSFAGDREVSFAGLAGLAFDAGGDHVRFDASLPLVGALAATHGGVERYYLLPILVVGEVGVRWEVGERSSLRAGMLGVLPGVDWHRQFGDDGKVLQIGVHSVVVVHTMHVGFSQPL